MDESSGKDQWGERATELESFGTQALSSLYKITEEAVAARVSASARTAFGERFRKLKSAGGEVDTDKIVNVDLPESAGAGASSTAAADEDRWRTTVLAILEDSWPKVEPISTVAASPASVSELPAGTQENTQVLGLVDTTKTTDPSGDERVQQLLSEAAARSLALEEALGEIEERSLARPPTPTSAEPQKRACSRAAVRCMHFERGFC